MMPRTEQMPEQTAATPRSRKGELTRSRLLDAAKTVFENTGFLEARISDIAVTAGLSHGSFYHYFDSKEQIFREVAEAQESLLTAPIDAPEATTDERTEFDRIHLANRFYLQRYRGKWQDHGRHRGSLPLRRSRQRCSDAASEALR